MSGFWRRWTQAPPHRDGTGSSGDRRVWPSFDGDRCVHALLATASCRACIEACPRAALKLGEDALELDTTACDGCGLCRPACPERAIEIAIAPELRHGAAHRGSAGRATAFAACDRVVAPNEHAAVPCLHAIGHGEIAGLIADGVDRLVVAAGDCDDCPRGSGNRLWDTASQLARVATSQGARAVEIERLAPPAWQQRLACATRRKAPVNPLRRGFLGLGRDPHSPFAPAHRSATALHAHVPGFDETRCEGCDACVRICPHGALFIVSDSRSTGYDTAPEACSGCGLCRDVCPADAIDIEKTSVRRPPVRLSHNRCRTCGAPFKLPESRPASAMCSVCVRKVRHMSLFQVKD